ncbi:hypothetical protein [Mycobacteroides abscessus]|uniref:hypothetical protein n=1 Tax=Mycobacteroides abscessus TaxID=36809 RepID=UPI000928D383|nr:hypothetical protein [Mycobacteroides abscessus]QST89619.1 hypothetical protein PROPHIGD62-3_26 [Mycobacterium phage prophi62-3]QST89962.1 hypothetical protein PROPHIGD108-1_26 [Mycobacterium phage prophi108-1]SHV97907.1 Uncharacterised protein [Mycobacteroides abscessus subsp. abscessus]SHW77424.1 Uncharacterised protein [Mycobacteroides abscessus subsp. abscessus]SII04350.1 Uncharacterised protein [Mycobacteroides abscessus subsp. abscessus]
MSTLWMLRQMGFRPWIAWQLVCLAARIHNPQWVEHITITTPDGSACSIEIIGDEYGSGISATTGIGWCDQRDGTEAADIGGGVQLHHHWPERIEDVR